MNREQRRRARLGLCARRGIATPAPQSTDPRDEAMAVDARWFGEHPGERFRYRPLLPGEVSDDALAEWLDDLPAGGELLLEVEQLAPGIRVKRPYMVLPQR